MMPQSSEFIKKNVDSILIKCTSKQDQFLLEYLINQHCYLIYLISLTVREVGREARSLVAFSASVTTKV